MTNTKQWTASHGLCVDDIVPSVDEIIPALGESIDPFVSFAVLRPPAVVLGEEYRNYNLNCYARKAYRDGSMPRDLV